MCVGVFELYFSVAVLFSLSLSFHGVEEVNREAGIDGGDLREAEYFGCCSPPAI